MASLSFSGLYDLIALIENKRRVLENQGCSITSRCLTTTPDEMAISLLVHTIKHLHV